MDAIRLPSYAKINLGLIIKGRRKDGFHEIETLLLQIDLKDEIELKNTEKPEIHFYCDNPEVPGGNANICVRAAHLIKQSSFIQQGVKINLKKVIPMGAGLGGGSSNGAVVLLGLNKLWNLQLQPKQLLELATQLGSDVPFFIHGGLALAQGRGELLSPFNMKIDCPILIVYPGIKIATKWAYGQMNLSLTMKKKSIKLMYFKDRNFNDVDFYNIFENEFEEIIYKNYPILRRIKSTISQKNPIFTSMSGSGSTIFAIFQKKAEALTVEQELRQQYVTFITRPVKWGYEQLFKKA
ncbi:MAG: 4-(cytidine 5'-diphospho)-2-C-methyl-D-erythritol kinase [bacterium]